jgi:hypothetical protein
MYRGARTPVYALKIFPSVQLEELLRDISGLPCGFVWCGFGG